MTLHSYIRRPHAATRGLKATDVARAYNLPAGDGAGVTIGVIELGGAFTASDMVGLNSSVTAVNIAGGKQKSDGPNGADGEVMLDIEVIAGVAPGAAIRVYFCPNTDAGFLAGITQAVAECDVVTISWGGPESSWEQASVTQFEAAFALARSHGVPVFVASGDSGSKDGTRANTTDYPASSPNVIGCGGTRLTLNSDRTRKAEVAWGENASEASGGGVSKLFAGRQVPDVAGNADPATGYDVTVDGQAGVIGGTSAVAPLYAAAAAVLLQLTGKARFDFLNLVTTNPTVCFDVTTGNNGGYKAGPGRDDVTGLGVVDFGRLLAVLTSGTQVPAPGGTTTPTPTPAPTPDAALVFLENVQAQIAAFLKTAKESK